MRPLALWAWAIRWRCSIDGRFLLPLSLPVGCCCRREIGSAGFWRDFVVRRPEKFILGSACVLVYPPPIWIFRLWWVFSFGGSDTTDTEDMAQNMKLWREKIWAED